MKGLVSAALGSGFHDRDSGFGFGVLGFGVQGLGWGWVRVGQ